jgi:hypothetical protein
MLVEVSGMNSMALASERSWWGIPDRSDRYPGAPIVGNLSISTTPPLTSTPNARGPVIASTYRRASFKTRLFYRNPAKSHPVHEAPGSSPTKVTQFNRNHRTPQQIKLIKKHQKHYLSFRESHINSISSAVYCHHQPPNAIAINCSPQTS